MILGSTQRVSCIWINRWCPCSRICTSRWWARRWPDGGRQPGYHKLYTYNSMKRASDCAKVGTRRWRRPMTQVAIPIQGDAAACRAGQEGPCGEDAMQQLPFLFLFEHAAIFCRWFFRFQEFLLGSETIRPYICLAHIWIIFVWNGHSQKRKTCHLKTGCHSSGAQAWGRMLVLVRAILRLIIQLVVKKLKKSLQLFKLDFDAGRHVRFFVLQILLSLIN
jgi:hypothetical protein